MALTLNGSTGIVYPDGDTDNRAGEMFDHAGSVAPSYALALPLVATNVSRITYAKLFAAIGTTWGVGDGSTTFGMPYCPAEHTLVQANGNVGSASLGEVKAHAHTFPSVSTAGSGASNGFTNINTGAPFGAYGVSTVGGSANLAAGMRVLKCVRIR